MDDIVMGAAPEVVAAPEPEAPSTAVAVVEHDSEPVAPPHVRLESGTMSELMVHIKAWLAWSHRQSE